MRINAPGREKAKDVRVANYEEKILAGKSFLKNGGSSWLHKRKNRRKRRGAEISLYPL